MKIEQIVIRAVFSVVVGIIIGIERARHGRAAGMRTHILVCLGAAMTSMTGLFIQEKYGLGDIARLSAQVISGVGFLGAGMIILKNDNVITGLTTAAGVWATATLGIAVGYGFYIGAITAALLCLITLTLFAKFERRKYNTQILYLEIENAHLVNPLLDQIREKTNTPPTVHIIPPKSAASGHIGMELVTDRRNGIDLALLLEMDGVLFGIEL